MIMMIMMMMMMMLMWRPAPSDGLAESGHLIFLSLIIREAVHFWPGDPQMQEIERNPGVIYG